MVTCTGYVTTKKNVSQGRNTRMLGVLLVYKTSEWKGKRGR
jgi:hypothetical protein